MAEVVIAAVITTAAEIGAELVFGELILSEIALSTVATAFAKHLVVNALVSAASNRGNPGSMDLAVQARELKQSIRGSVQPRRILYGRTRVSGLLAYAGSGGTNHELLSLVVPLAHGEVDAVETLYLNDLPSTDARYTGFVSYTAHLGGPGQAADDDLIAMTADWSADHKLSAIAYLHLQLTFDATAFPTGIPNPTAVVRGRKVYDPRTGLTVWSNNAALCILDYLRGRVPTVAGTEPVGIGAADSEIDFDSFTAAANVCDEDVAVLAGGTQKRYTLDGAVAMDASPAQAMEQMLTSCAGVLVHSGGKYRLHAGAATVAAFTITENMLRGPIKFRPLVSRREGVNTVRGTYIDPGGAYEAADFPAQSTAAYVTEDGGEIIPMDLQLPFTHNATRAQRIARQFLERSRRAGMLEIPCNWQVFHVALWDTVYVDSPHLGWTGASARKFRVTAWTLAEGGGVDLTLQDEADAAYLWDTSMEVTVPAAPHPTLIRASDVASPTSVTGTSASHFTPEGAVVGRLRMGWTPSANAFVAGYEMQYRPNGETTWRPGANVGAVNEAFVNFLNIGAAYDARIRAVALGGTFSPWTQVSNVTISGDASAPSAPSSFTATGQAANIRLTWTNPSESDFIKTKIWRHTADDRDNASFLIDVFGVPGSAGLHDDPVASGQTRYYWARAADASGNLSNWTAVTSATAT